VAAQPGLQPLPDGEIVGQVLTERREALSQWLHTYHRGHTALKGLPPASRVPNLTGQYT
jgi:hypothetical protein